SVVGRYVFSPDIWEALEYTPLGAGDEIQLTDAIAILMKSQAVNAYHIMGRSHDCGNKLGYMQAFVEYGLRDKHLGPDFTRWLAAIAAKLG
ncbi:MAG: UTP--glucose-1-phosphate uridylyltransferase, partial [Paraglaciecola sp.]|nr:UTP--glucose-1-phosphate uridylyltransferase [Paraglaciecola sp.]